ncbi:MAG: SIMPL domain-containing protein [Flavisolibacter sp.]
MKTFNLKTILVSSILAVAFILPSKSTIAQEISKKQITVTGSAEMSIDPDQVEISVVLHTTHSDYDKREDEFIKICKKYKIPEDQLAFKGSSNDWSYWNYWYYWWYYRNSSYQTQTYKIKISSGIDLLEFVKELNKPWIQNISISATSNKNMPLYRKEVKKEAIRMAKEKAAYLLEAIDEKIGSVISVEEMTSDNGTKHNNQHNGYNGYYWHNPYYGYYGGNNGISNSNSNMNSNSVMSSGNVAGGTTNSAEDAISGLSKIKIRYEVKTVFEIK